MSAPALVRPVPTAVAPAMEGEGRARPFVIEPGRFVEVAQLPRSARLIAQLAIRNGWDVRCGMGRAWEPDTKHFGADGNWDRPKAVTRDEPQYEDDGSPILTPTGAAKLAQARELAQACGWPEPEVELGWISVKKVPTDELVSYEWAAVVAVRDGKRIHATWEKPSTGDAWSFRDALLPGVGVAGSPQMKAALGAPR